MKTSVENLHPKLKWLNLWEQIGERILKLPEIEQDILLSDILTAIQNRLIVYEAIIGSVKVNSPKYSKEAVAFFKEIGK